MCSKPLRGLMQIQLDKLLCSTHEISALCTLKASTEHQICECVCVRSDEIVRESYCMCSVCC